MKRLIAALFAVAVFAEDTVTDGTAEGAEGEGDVDLDKVGDWFSSRQEPVAYTSIASASPCMLDGNYHWYKNIGVDGVVIRTRVSDCDIEDGAMVLTWAEIEDPDTPGNIEGFYCTIEFSQVNATATASADVETLTGTGVDFKSWNDLVRTTWCDENSEADCDRMSISQWQKLASDAQTNYPIEYDSATSKGDATCTAHRFLSTPNNYMEIKTGTPYKVTSGFKIYSTGADYQNGVVSDRFGSGSANEFTFEAATTLLAGAALISATLLA